MAASHICTALRLTVASIVPSGLNATDSAPPFTSAKGPPIGVGWLVVTFHSCTGAPMGAMPLMPLVPLKPFISLMP